MDTAEPIVKKHFISFTLGKEYFAIDVQNIIQIFQITSVTRVPQAPKFLKGVTNYNGNVIPVINTHQKFGFEEPQNTDRQLLLVLSIQVEDSTAEVGIIVDKSEEVFEINEQELKPYPVQGGKYKTDYIDAVIHRKEHFLLVINVERLFSKKEFDEFVKQE